MSGSPSFTEQWEALRLWVFWIANRLHRRNRRAEVEDLSQEAAIGLLRAMATFDAARGVPFEQYAKALMRRRMWKTYRRAGAIREVPDDFDFDLMALEGPTDVAWLEEYVATLPQRERLAIRCYFGLSGELPRTLDGIASEWGRTRNVITRLVARGLRRLRRRIDAGQGVRPRPTAGP